MPAKGFKKQFCPKGHDTFITGRDRNNSCFECKLIWSKENMNEYSRTYYLTHSVYKIEQTSKYNQEHKEQVSIYRKMWFMQNPEYLKQYIKDNPDIRRLSSAKIRVKRVARLVSFGQNGIKEIYKDKPENKTVDHIIPLCGKKVSGLHVSWNLQYLTKVQNSSKCNRVDLLEASSWYGRILKEAGLK